MSNEGNSDLNVVLGQLEDELLKIKYERELADSVIAANSGLSTKLERVIIEIRELVERTNTQTRSAAETLVGEVDRLSEQTEAIKESATDSIEAIKKQASDAQSTFEEAANNAVDKASSQMSEFTKQAIFDLNEGIDEAKNEISIASESAKTAASDVKTNSEALLHVSESAASENKRQNEETRALLNEAQGHLADIDASIATLKEIGIDSLIDEIKELKTVMADSIAMLKNKIIAVTIMAGASVVVCLATLLKLLLG